MTPSDFIGYVYQNMWQSILFCTLLVSTYLFLYRKSISSLADPLFLGVIASSFSAGAIAILIFLGKIETNYLVSFVLTEIAFVTATLWRGGTRLKLRRIDLSVSKDFQYLTFHYLLTIVFLISSITYLLNAGLPVLQEVSRLVTFQNLGMLTWLLDVTWIGVPLSVLLKRHFLKRKNIFDFFLIAFSFFLFATKGGKSDIVYILFVIHTFAQVTGSTTTKIIEWALLLALPILIGLVTSIVLVTWGVEVSALQIVFERFLLFGDVFFMGYNEAFLATVPDIGIIDYFFGGIKSSINTLLGNDAGERYILGYAISQFYYGFGEGIGPNARHNILGLILWGPIFALAFSVFCGVAFRLCRRYVYRNGKNIFSAFLYCLVNVYAWTFFIDPPLAVGYLLKIIIVVSPLAMFAYFLNSVLTSCRREPSIMDG